MRYLSIVFATALVFLSCKKDKDDQTLTNFKNQLRILNAVPSFEDISVSVSGGDNISTLPAGYGVTVSYMKTSATAWNSWKTVPVTSSLVKLTDSIDVSATYDIKLELTYGGTTELYDRKTVTIASFYFDVQKLINEDSLYLYSDQQTLYSLEGAVHKIYGSDFSKVKQIKGQLVARQDSTQKVDVAINTIDDRTLTFTMPTVLTDKDYQKKFYLKLNNSCYLNSTFNNDTMFYNVTSNGIHVDTSYYYPDTTNKGCNTVVFTGHFGVAGFNLYTDYLYGYPVKVSTTHLSISNDAGEIAGSYDAALSGSGSACGAVGINFGWSAFSHVVQLWMRSGIKPGTYTLIVYNIMIDGSKKFSNQYKFTVK